MIVEESGKLYNIDEETGLVTEASVVNPELEDEFHLGDRVEVTGSTGQIVSIVPSYYGVAFGVRFDDGEFDEFLETQLKRSTVETPTYDSPYNEVMARFTSYRELPTYTNDELDAKESEARWLKLRATTMVADRSLSLGEQNELGQILLTTADDLREIEELRANSEESQQYLARFNHYKVAEDIASGGVVVGGKDDASWLDKATEGMEVVETTDADLATRATEVVSVLGREQLADDEFMRVAGSYQHSYLKLNADQIKTFNVFLTQAREARLKELPTETKTASVEYNLDDATDIFI